MRLRGSWSWDPVVTLHPLFFLQSLWIPRPHPGSVSKSRRPRLLLGSLPTPKHFASTAEELLSLWQALPTKKPQPAEGRGRRVFDVQSGNSKSLFVQEAPPRALSARSAPALSDPLSLCLAFPGRVILVPTVLSAVDLPPRHCRAVQEFLPRGDARFLHRTFHCPEERHSALGLLLRSVSLVGLHPCTDLGAS